MKKRILSILLALVLVLTLGLVTAAPVLAAPSAVVTVTWLEDATRYNPDGTEAGQWQDDFIGPMDLHQTGKAYHALNIAQFYNVFLPDIEGSLVISGAGNLSGHVTYTSLASGLPIKERLRGNVIIDPQAGTMVGAYTQWAYAYGSDVLSSYPNAVPANKQGAGWWFIGYTVYTAHQ